MLRATARHPCRPAHIHFLTTQVFRSGDEYLDSDAVFGAKTSLIAHYVRHDPGTAPDGTKMAVPFYTMRCDFVLSRRR